MGNKTIEKIIREKMSSLLSKCSEEQKLMFKRMYFSKDSNLPIEHVIGEIPFEKLDYAITQIERTLNKITN